MKHYQKCLYITNNKTEPLFKKLFKYTYDNIPIEYIRQQYDTAKRIRPWGTTDAICCLLGYVEEPFILVNSDDIYGEDAFKQGYNYLHTTSKNIIGVSYLKNTICGKGLINGGIVDIQENSDIVVSLKETLGINIKTNMNYFVIKDKIIRLTYPSDIPSVKYFLI